MISVASRQQQLNGNDFFERNVFTEQDGRWGKHYDLRIAEPMGQETPETIKASEALLWSAFEAFQDPVLVVRGENSDLLTPDTTQKMLARNSQAQLFTVPDVGHAPTLRSDDQISPIERFLRE